MVSEPNKSPRPILELVIKGGLLCLLIGFGVSLATPNFIGPRRSGAAWNAHICISNLRQIDGAESAWAAVHKATNGEVVTVNQIREYLVGGMPKCPSGGAYTLGKVGGVPTCSLGKSVNPAHVLPPEN